MSTRSNAPLSLFNDAPPVQRCWSQDACSAVFAKVANMIKGGGDVMISVDSRWQGNLRWSANRIVSSGDTNKTIVTVRRTIRGAWGYAKTTRIDEIGLRDAVAQAESRALLIPEDPDASSSTRPLPHAKPDLYAESTASLSAQARSNIGRDLVQPIVAEDRVSAGYVEVGAHSRGVLDNAGKNLYYAETTAQYSVTVRNTKETGSGWAGSTASNWSRIDAAALSARALEKCKRSEDPRAVEPGRYTVVLEPQAVHDLFVPAIQALDRDRAERMHTVYTESANLSKIGQQMLDRRLTVTSDPTDPDGGFFPFDWWGEPFQAVSWFNEGYLRELAYDRGYAIRSFARDVPLPNSQAYRMSGGTASVDELVASTQRGILVTRFSDVRVLDEQSMLLTGVTRDGLWLIENGKISRPVVNFRFVESPFFVLNNVEMLGKAERVFSLNPAVVPALKLRDFSFTSLVDAV